MDFNYTNDFVNSFWALYVVVISVVSFVGCGIFLWLQSSVKFNPGQTTGHVWDETLAEFSNPLPNWWRWLFFITVIFSLAYLAVYPGLGTYNGQFNWTMRNQYDEEMKKADQQYGPIFNKFLKQDVMTVAANPEAKEMGQRLFLTYCAQCHGSDARGGKGFPNLADKDWLLGGTPARITDVITKGHDAVMTPKGTKPDMNDEQVKDVVDYVRSLSGLSSDPIRVQRGQELYPQACAACHGPDAKGNQDAGYPNLTDNVWLYGTRKEDMIDTVTNGRINRMPAWGEFLGPAKIHLLTAYVWGLGGGEKPAVEAAPVAAAGEGSAAPAAAAPEQAAPFSAAVQGTTK